MDRKRLSVNNRMNIEVRKEFAKLSEHLQKYVRSTLLHEKFN